MIEMLEKTAQDIGLKLAAEFDARVATAISKRLGHTRWALEEMRGRLHEVAMKGCGWSTLYLDGEPLLKISEVRVEEVAGVMTATREYRDPV